MNKVEKESLEWLEVACKTIKEDKKMIILKLKTGRNITFLFDTDDDESVKKSIITRWLELHHLTESDVEEQTELDPRAV